MRKRIAALTLAAAMLAITLFGVPLAIAAAQYYLTDERAELERAADAAALTIAADTLRGITPRHMPAVGDTTDLALYGRDGVRVLGDGPATLRAATRIQPGDVIDTDMDDDLVAIVPISDGSQVTGVVRAATPHTEVLVRTGLTWLAMALLASVALITTWLIARRQASRLAAPLEELSTAARRLGDGDFTVRTPRAGIPEIDSVRSALDTTAERLNDLLARERAFSSEASHQLRTPLAGLRLQLESALDDPRADPQAAITAGLATTDRLDRTITDLLALARDTHHGDRAAPLGPLITELEHEWHGPLAANGRALRVSVDPEMTACLVAGPVVRQVVAVLLDNASKHGTGTVSVLARDAGDTLAVDVADEGTDIDPGADVFQRRSDHTDAGDGVRDARHGIGLALARRLAEAEGGRLRLTRRSPTTFTLLLPLDTPAESP
ncbi:sensor histidine kinase [Labedaea rhizosphaerae]|uniref:histidine kinase n=1 Tax=Labedaea rhizosphaerae TaxID=598644 RepID=A0A4R6SG52_LABRH|nr:HAMP domain-containing sensor histidine kinase [Labedaea rhizosphaerae]TDQ00665.1 signal transduction histidine kinase [Labedaea rhizosphaerae]